MTQSFADHSARVGDHPIVQYLDHLREEAAPLYAGEVASYIPELAKADPEHLAIAIATTDGRVFSVGDARVPFTIQSVSKPFAYGRAFAAHGRAGVLKHVGVEPTGDSFNSIVLDDAANRPYNPMVNAGAIAVAELYPGATQQERIDAMRAALSSFAGRDLDMDENVYRSESMTGNRNRAIAYLMRASDMITHDPEKVLDVYFRQCSMLVDCRDLAVMAATLANRGVNPLTGVVAMPAEFVQDVLTVMHSCGMYDYAGHWSYEVGIPAKSGVSGCVIAVVPGQIGIAAYSPRLDSYGNSVRAVAACRKLSADFGLHVFRGRPGAGSVFRHEFEGLQICSQRVRPPEERAILKSAGGAIRILEAQGDLFFGTTERLVRRILELSRVATHVIVDFAHVQRADRAALLLLQGLAKDAVGPEGCRLIFASLRAEGRIANLHAALKASQRPDSRVFLFDGLDAALERAEDETIRSYGRPAREGLAPLETTAIFRGLEPEEMRALVAAVDPKLIGFSRGDVIIKKGEIGGAFYAIAQGSVSVELPSLGCGDKSVRIASIGVGLTFGELALIEGRPRGAQVVAEGDVACYEISLPALREFGRAHPAIFVKILMNVLRDLADTLKFSNESVRALKR